MVHLVTHFACVINSLWLFLFCIAFGLIHFSFYYALESGNHLHLFPQFIFIFIYKSIWLFGFFTSHPINLISYAHTPLSVFTWYFLILLYIFKLQCFFFFFFFNSQQSYFLSFHNILGNCKYNNCLKILTNIVQNNIFYKCIEI